MKSLRLADLKQAAHGHFQSGVFHRLNARLLQERFRMYEDLSRAFTCLRDEPLVTNLNRALGDAVWGIGGTTAGDRHLNQALGDAVVAVEEAHRREGAAP